MALAASSAVLTLWSLAAGASLTEVTAMLLLAVAELNAVVSPPVYAICTLSKSISLVGADLPVVWKRMRVLEAA